MSVTRTMVQVGDVVSLSAVGEPGLGDVTRHRWNEFLGDVVTVVSRSGAGGVFVLSGDDLADVLA